jgi:hypothetical protein
MIELLFLFLIVFIVAVISRRLDKLPASAQIIFIFSGILVGWFVTGFRYVTEPPVSAIKKIDQIFHYY